MSLWCGYRLTKTNVFQQFIALEPARHTHQLLLRIVQAELRYKPMIPTERCYYGVLHADLRTVDHLIKVPGVKVTSFRIAGEHDRVRTLCDSNTVTVQESPRWEPPLTKFLR